VPQKGKFVCPYCGNKEKIIESIRKLPQERRLPVRPYAQHAHLSRKICEQEIAGPIQEDLFVSATKQKAKGKHQEEGGDWDRATEVSRLLPKSGKFFKAFTASDRTRLQQAEALWGKNKDYLPYPRSKISLGEKTKSGLLAHHYNYWHEMFLPRQLLGLATVLDGITDEGDETLKEMLLRAFSNTLEPNNVFTRHGKRNTPGGQPAAGVFARHAFQPKTTILEQNVWGTISGRGVFINDWQKLVKGKEYNTNPTDRVINNNKQCHYSSTETTNSGAHDLFSYDARSLPSKQDLELAITDPPYVGNVNYFELSDFFYVWFRLGLKDKYSNFSPEYTPKVSEIVQNRTRGKSRSDFYNDLSQVFSIVGEALWSQGLLVFTFHHTDQPGTVWEGLLQALCNSGFEILAVYPIHGESESSLHLMEKENVSYDLIHICRKRRSVPEQRSWAGIRQEIPRQARAELKTIEEGRYGKEPLLSAVDEVNKAIRAMQVNGEDLKKAGLIVRGRTGRGRTDEVKQPTERLNALLEKLKAPEIPGGIQGTLFDDVGDPVVREVRLVDLVHLLIGLAEGGQSVAPWLERFSWERPRVRAALRFIRDARPDWKGPLSTAFFPWWMNWPCSGMRREADGRIPAPGRKTHATHQAQGLLPRIQFVWTFLTT